MFRCVINTRLQILVIPHKFYFYSDRMRLRVCANGTWLIRTSILKGKYRYLSGTSGGISNIIYALLIHQDSMSEHVELYDCITHVIFEGNKTTFSF